jgi:hypothetical protein
MFNLAVANDVPQQAQKTESVGHDQHQTHMVENGRLKEEMEILKREHEAKMAKTHLEHDAGHRVLNERIGTMEAEHGRAMGQHHNEWHVFHTASKQELELEIKRLHTELAACKGSLDSKTESEIKEELKALNMKYKIIHNAEFALMTAYDALVRNTTEIEDKTLQKQAFKVVASPIFEDFRARMKTFHNKFERTYNSTPR